MSALPRVTFRCLNPTTTTTYLIVSLDTAVSTPPTALQYPLSNNWSDLSRDVRKPAFCICENKDADQLRGNREADQRLCFRYTDSTIPLLPKSEISSL